MTPAIMPYVREHSSTVGDPKVLAMGAPAHPEASTTAGDSGSITSNDFLTLLVTEMKNQDPTANTDPNEYVNQLVQVNSLQQLISINEILQKASGMVPSADARQHQLSGEYRSITSTSGSPNCKQSGTDASETNRAREVAGNLSVPSTGNAAARVAEALSVGRLDRARHQATIQGNHDAVITEEK